LYNFTVIDFETYFDSDYTLKKLNTEEYIRDPRFKIHCVAVYSANDKKVFTENFKENLAPYINGFVIAQKAQFDGLILSHHLGLYPAYWGDTISMAKSELQFLERYSLEKLAEYYGYSGKTIDYNAFKGRRELDAPTMKMLTEGCLYDAELTYCIAEKLLETIQPHQLQIIDATIRLFTEPVLELDSPLVEKELKRVREAKEKALEELQVTKEQLHSAKKFGEILESYGVAVPLKLSPKTGKEIPALAKTDEGMKELLAHENDTIAALAAARLGEKSTLMETRCTRFLGMAQRGALPVFLNYHGAHTGRWSGGDKTNFQNLTRGSVLRKAIIAPPGYKFVGVDSAQIECRLLNWFAGQENIIEAFRVGRDIYCENASKFFDRQITKANENERQFGKEIELACGFNMGALKFQNRVLQKYSKRLTMEESERAITIYRSGHPKVVGLWRCFQEVIRNMGKGLPPYEIACIIVDGYKLIMPDGTFLDYTGLCWSPEKESYMVGDTKIYGGLMTENVIQKLGWVIVCNAMNNISDKYNYKLATTTHDDVLYVVPENDTGALARVLMEFKTPPSWATGLPLGAEGFEGKRYDK
jgi:DNA polymerase I-like protein with 3'-5' exonuclease and polymerase domains